MPTSTVALPLLTRVRMTLIAPSAALLTEILGPFISYTVYPALTGACSGQTIIITESGWPSRGATNGQAVPSLANEQSALYALNCAASGGANIYAFEYDGEHPQEQHVWRSRSNA